MMADLLVLGGGGMNGDADPRLLTALQYAKGINVTVKRGRITTRNRVVVHPVIGDSIEDHDFQGACYYNPSRGQSFQGFGPDFSSLAISASGRTFLASPVARSKNAFRVADITGNLPRDRGWNQCHMFQAENYLIVAQANSDTWIYPGNAEPFFSPGMNFKDKEKSRLPNACTVGLYAHNRIHLVHDGRKLLVGDIIHKKNATNAENILETTEQSYWATGSWFSPPSDWDELTCCFVLPLQNTNHGQAEVMVGSPSGIMSVNTQLYPRSSWSDTQMIRHALVGTGPMGPYAALPITDGDVFFRSRYGIQTLRSSATQGRTLGGPITQVGQPVAQWLDADTEALLRYASLAKMERARTIKATTAPWVNGYRWGHRGVVSMNLQPSATQDLLPAWEGLDTLPDEIKYPVQLISCDFDRSERMMAICYGADDKMRIAEFTQEQGDDILEDYTPQRIPCSITTRAFTGDVPLVNKTWQACSVLFSEMRGIVTYTIDARTELHPEWRRILDGESGFTKCSAEDPFALFYPGSDANTAQFPNEMNSGRWVQVRVSWLGQATLDGVRLQYTAIDPNEDTINTRITCASIPNTTSEDNDFRHSLP